MHSYCTLATISDNIANSNTFGYKRAYTDFHSLVLDQTQGKYAAGGVRATSGRYVGDQGTLIGTQNPTDLAIGGKGMLPVTPVSAIGAQSGALPLHMSSTGSFRPDADGILRSDSGYALLGWPAAPDGTIPTFPRDSFGGLEPIRVAGDQWDGNPTTQITLGVNLPATDTQAGAPGTPRNLSLEYFGNLGEAENLNIVFTPDVPASGNPPTNRWTMQITDDAQAGALIGEFTVQFDDTPANGGTIQAVTQNPGDPGTWTPGTGLLSMTTLSGPMDIDIGVPLELGGLSQLSDTFAPLSISKDGSAVGNLTSYEVDERGILSAVYDSGFTNILYQIPVIDVPNPNGLNALSNQAYEVSRDSGPFYLWDAGDGPVGDMIGFAREESTTDVASELTSLIQTQRAYSSNAKVIQTVDEMLQETTNIKR